MGVFNNDFRSGVAFSQFCSRVFGLVFAVVAISQIKAGGFELQAALLLSVQVFAFFGPLSFAVMAFAPRSVTEKVGTLIGNPVRSE